MSSPNVAPAVSPSGSSGKLDEVEQMLRDADSFIDTVETLTGASVGLAGLQRDKVQLDALQAAQLACTRFRGSESLLNSDTVTGDQQVAHRFSPVTSDDGTKYAEVESFLVLPRLWASAVRSLFATDTTLGRTVYPQGVKRKTIGVVRLAEPGAEIKPDTEVFRVRGRLDLGDVPVALVREDLLGSAVLAYGG